MPSTARILRDAAFLIHSYGLHTDTQFVERGTDAMDVCAAIYIAATESLPAEFYTDEIASLRLIECSAGAMQAIRALSAALDSEPCTTEIAPGVDVPDHIEHVSNWAATAPIGEHFPPSTAEVIGRIHRAANALEGRSSALAA